MSIARYHIDKVSQASPGLFWVLVLGGVCTALVAFFSRSGGLIGFVNRKLNAIHNDVEGVLDQINTEGLDAESAKKKYTHVERVLSKYKNIYNRLDKANFFNNDKTKEVSNALLVSLYSLEYQYRTVAFCDLTPSEEDKNLIDFASELSLGSLQA
jgi:hypothetical protein